MPNFILKLVRPTFAQRENVVTFACSMEMTQFDVKNYLEKIYGIPVKEVRTRIGLGEFKRQQGKGYIIKDDDVKYAFVTLVRFHCLSIKYLVIRKINQFLFQPENEKFVFPDIFPETETTKMDRESQKMKESKNSFREFLDKNKKRTGLPGWFSI